MQDDIKALKRELKTAKAREKVIAGMVGKRDAAVAKFLKAWDTWDKKVEAELMKSRKKAKAKK